MGVEVGKKEGVEVGKKVEVDVGNNNKKWLQTKSFFVANKLIAKPTIHTLNNSTMCAKSLYQRS